MAKLRGQCYDGYNTMAKANAGIANKVEELEPKAVFTHYYVHALNLSVGDKIRQSAAMTNCLDTWLLICSNC